jgi:hypothetical protein
LRNLVRLVVFFANPISIPCFKLERLEFNQKARGYFADVVRKDKKLVLIIFFVLAGGILLPFTLKRWIILPILAISFAFLLAALADLTTTSTGGSYSNFIQAMYINTDGFITQVEMVQLHRRKQIVIDIGQEGLSVSEVRRSDLPHTFKGPPEPIVALYSQGYKLLKVAYKYEDYYFVTDFFDRNPFVVPHYIVTDHPVWK